MYEITIKDLDSDLEMHAQIRFIAAMWDTAEEQKADGGEGGIKEVVLGMASPNDIVNYCVTLDEMKDTMIKRSPLAALAYAMTPGSKFPSFISDSDAEE